MARFVKRMTDISEELRGLKDTEREEQLQARLPELQSLLTGRIYLPTCRSSDPIVKV